MERLRDDGHEVEVPESGVNPDFDARVDGTPVDFAVTDNPQYVAQKLERDSEALVYTNREMGAAFEDNPRVVVDEEMSVQEMFHETARTFEGIEDLGGLFEKLPVITLVLSGARNAYKVVKRDKSVAEALEHTALDTAGVGIGGYAGAELGLIVGLALAPVTGGASAIVVPVVSTLLFSTFGVIGGRRVVRWVAQRHLRRAARRLHEATGALRSVFLDRFDAVRAGARRAYIATEERFAAERSTHQGWFMRTLFPRVLVKFYSLAVVRLREDGQAAHALYEQLKAEVEAADDHRGGLLVYRQPLALFASDPPTVAAHRAVGTALTDVERERRKL